MSALDDSGAPSDRVFYRQTDPRKSLRSYANCGLASESWMYPFLVTARLVSSPPDVRFHSMRYVNLLGNIYICVSCSVIGRPTTAGGIRFGRSSVTGGSAPHAPGSSDEMIDSGRKLSLAYLNFTAKSSVALTVLIGCCCEN